MRRRYFVCNDRSHSDARRLHGESGFRDSTGSYIHYRANGTIEPVVIDAVGIGEVGTHCTLLCCSVCALLHSSVLYARCTLHAARFALRCSSMLLCPVRYCPSWLTD